MESKMAKRLRDVFRERMRQLMPTFREKPHPLNKLGAVLWESVINSDHQVYVLLLPAPKSDKFTIEMAWTRTSEFPMNLICQTPRDIPELDISRETPVNGSFRFRLPFLWTKNRDAWWSLSKHSELDWIGIPVTNADDISPKDITGDIVKWAIDDAIEQIQRHGLPFVIEDIERHLPTK
jgi:hypothetical protein